MSNFIKIVKNYERVCRLGHQIINHKDIVRRACPSKLGEEFRKQDARIQEFVDATNKASKEWKKSPYSVNEYWKGLS
uniref:Uncharacterized protein n=1 Tax=viral metagenome TaxID=1070528 RepID=A0A6C0EPQ5_9ZZZZ